MTKEQLTDGKVNLSSFLETWGDNQRTMNKKKDKVKVKYLKKKLFS